MKRFAILAIALLALFLPHGAMAAIAFDNSGSAGATSMTYTVGSGSNRYLIACSYAADNAHRATGFTYDGVAMTKIVTGTNSATPGNIDMWALPNPHSGALTLASSGGTGITAILALSYTGVDQTTPPAADGSDDQIQTTTTTSISNSITTTANNDWMVTCGLANSVINSFTNGTIRTNITSPGRYVSGDSNAAITPAGGYTITINTNSGNRKNQIGAGIKAAATNSFAPWMFQAF